MDAFFHRGQQVPQSPLQRGLGSGGRFAVSPSVAGGVKCRGLDCRAMIVLILVAVGGPFLLSAVTTAVVRSLGQHAGFVDTPHAHKRHEKPVVLGGGVAIFVGIALPVVVGTAAARYLHGADVPSFVPWLIREHLDGMSSKFPVVLALMACVLVLHVVGLIDDRRALGPVPKFAAQIAVALVTAWPLGIRMLEFLPAPVSIFATVVWIVLITNAFNFLDNMDGLSAGVAAIGAGIFAVASLSAGQVFVPVLACVMVGSLLGFLVFNRAPASIFMGDAGSLVVGYLMGVVTILTTFYDPGQKLQPMGVLVPVVVLAVPLYDSLSVIILRLRARESPFRGDHRHFSHRLVRRGMSRSRAVHTVYLAAAATGLPAIALPRVSWPIAALLVLQCLCVVTMIALLEYAGSDRA